MFAETVLPLSIFASKLAYEGPFVSIWFFQSISRISVSFSCIDLMCVVMSVVTFSNSFSTAAN